MRRRRAIVLESSSGALNPHVFDPVPYEISKAMLLDFVRYLARFDGALELEVLRQSLDEIVRRHEVLRTRFVTVDGEPRQQIDPPRQVAVEEVDLTDHPQTERWDRALRARGAAGGRPAGFRECPRYAGHQDIVGRCRQSAAWH